jgi:hypothetical protein
MRRGALAGIIAVVAIFLAYALGIVRCPVAMVFHVPCPGCGTTRAAFALLHLDVAQAFRWNPVAPLLLAILAAIGVRALILIVRQGHARTLDEERLGRALLLGLVACLPLQLLVWALRFAGFFGGPCPV